MLFLKYKRLKLKLRVLLAGHSVAMVTYCVTKIIPTGSLVIAQFFDTMIVASTDRVVIMTHQNLRLGKSWNVLETVSSHLKQRLILLGSRLFEASDHKIHGKSGNENNERIAGLKNTPYTAGKTFYTLKVTREFKA